MSDEEIKIGSYVKVRCNGERFWCEVIGFDSDKGIIKTRIDNKLIMSHDMSIDDVLWIEPKDIIDVYKDAK